MGKYLFEIAGELQIDIDFEPLFDQTGAIITGLRLADGTTLRLVMALEVEPSPTGSDPIYEARAEEMARRGIEVLQYVQSDMIAMDF